ncbi:MAG: PilZ domain-containing protein [Candidatus Omnitrophica bacterium]|nr:PilZ domain-containing protein [Candidatus Omnitrophota bacterium]MBU1090348.1 PilZ domain-containing protein [Candidatus Omnitrophota bacterium]
MENNYPVQERREFLRLDCTALLGCKICNKGTISKLFQGYSLNISEAGILCKIKEKVKKEDVLWLSFDRSILSICEELERRVLIYQNGVIGKVVRIEHKQHSDYSVGIKFFTREEKNLTNIYPDVHFLRKNVEGK